MGIPAFYRWLVDRYPLSVVQVIEEAPKVVNAAEVPIDTRSPNPNGMEFDNLYLDMNGIIHPCFHPEDQPAPTSYDEVYKAVFKYIDHIFSLIRPRKLLFMAVDGVAPRAKMNQQRARRFRAAKDLADAAAEAEKLSGFEMVCEKLALLEKTRKMDSNVITPGTEFMASLSLALQYYIQLRLNTYPGWKIIKVILSDANVPGEGEHKIASYIRAQRNQPGFDPNTRHCLYGLDADLIMLALATHEIHFSILREDVRVGKKNESIAKSSMKRRLSSTVEGEGLNKNDSNHDMRKIKFQFLHIWVLRDYLEHDLRIPGFLQKVDLERLIDDFVFICLFVGNDFLPHIPSLEISEGAIDLLVNVYRREFARMGGYLTNSSEVDLNRVEHFLQVVGSHENAIFRRRMQLRKGRDIHLRATSVVNDIANKNGSSWMENSQNHTQLHDKKLQNNTLYDSAMKTKVSMVDEGWKERYYADKFEANTENDCSKLKGHAVLKYVEGICWFMHYYYQGVCSWQWFYPYHYAPFASDFTDLKPMEVKFALGVPFKPFDQLMGVLPAASAHALPSSYRKLMTDSSSSIIDFYPPDFDLDLNGKRFAWQAVCKLPFVEESRLLQEIKRVEHTLTDDEKKRNSCTVDMLFVHIRHPIAPKIVSFFKRRKEHPKLSKVKLKKKLDPNISGGVNGYVYLSDKTDCLSEIYSPVEGMETIKKNQTIFVYYKAPLSWTHIPRVPGGATIPKKLISEKDVRPPPVLWHEKSFIRRRIYCEKPVPDSIAGGHLSRQANQLISHHYCRNKRDTNARRPGRKDTTNGGSTLGKRKRKGHKRGMETVIRRGVNPENNSVSGKGGHRDLKRRTRKTRNKDKKKGN